MSSDNSLLIFETKYSKSCVNSRTISAKVLNTFKLIWHGLFQDISFLNIGRKEKLEERRLHSVTENNHKWLCYFIVSQVLNYLLRISAENEYKKLIRVCEDEIIRYINQIVSGI